jgi:hypothetical protein
MLKFTSFKRQEINLVFKIKVFVVSKIWYFNKSIYLYFPKTWVVTTTRCRMRIINRPICRHWQRPAFCPRVIHRPTSQPRWRTGQHNSGLLPVCSRRPVSGSSGAMPRPRRRRDPSHFHNLTRLAVQPKKGESRASTGILNAMDRLGAS